MSDRKKTVTIGDKVVGDGQPVYIVFEAGPTHDGLKTAKKLVKIAAQAGADAIKFQIIDAEKIVSGHDVMFTYTRLVDKQSGKTEQVTEPLLQILKRRQLTFAEWEEIIAYCKQNKLDFFATVSNEYELTFLENAGVDSVKICSGDVNYFYFLRKVAKYNFSIQLDTGCSTIGEIESAVDVLEKAGQSEIIINHCPSGYPSKLQGVNLRLISTLKCLFPYPVAFSDHSPGYDMDIAAVALGANMVEKTITLDSTTRSPEHIMSLEPNEMRVFVQKIRDLEIALGGKRKSLVDGELQGRIVARRSLFAATDLVAGEKLHQDKIHYSRPGDGIPADMDYFFVNRRLTRNVKKGEKLLFSHFE